jgi:NADPH-dependent F420 reductase
VKIGIIGGTGDIGEGMALRFSQKHDVIIGSREKEKACTTSEATVTALRQKQINTCSCAGEENQRCVEEGDIVVLAIPFRFVRSTLAELSGFEDKIVVSPVNPLGKKESFFYDPPPEGSAALLIRSLLPESTKVVAAFNNIAANCWRDLENPLDYSVAVCGDDLQAKEVVMELVGGTAQLGAFDAGPLETSSIVESITPLLLNLARYNRMRDVGVQFH